MMSTFVRRASSRVQIPSMVASYATKTKPSSDKAILYYPDGTVPLAPAKPLAVAPFEVTLAAGEERFWCACGYANTQPWCDGSHRKKLLELRLQGAKIKNNYHEVTPGKYTVCGCKLTKRPPFCDGSHCSIREDKT